MQHQNLRNELTRISRKRIVKQFWSKHPKGIVASTVEEAVVSAEKLTADTGTSWWVIKAQVHAGGR